ncbi:MAG: hypothetical protein KGL10_00035 [Alphaproteobacteria bacterium]|nr:hypothetical protein [Alphaproteobacteria bacterium]MDE2335679.1 hypothetical protein [Alphaproteobacteria bacterium]
MSLKIRKPAVLSTALALGLALSGCTTDGMSLPDVHLSSLNPFHAPSSAAAPQAAPQDAGQMPKVPEEPVSGTPVPQPDTPPLICKIGRGSARFSDGWHDFRDATFTLYDGVSGAVSLTAVHSAQKMTLQALFDKRGQKLLFCPTIEGAADGRIACASIYALQSDLDAGIKRTFDVPEAERDGDITCAYTEDRLRSFKLPPG